MELLSEDDLNLRDLDDEELARAWDLWFDLAQATNDSDPPYTHGVFVNVDSRQLTVGSWRQDGETRPFTPARGPARGTPPPPPPPP